MKKVIFAIAPLFLGLLFIFVDYHRYFKGESVVDYHILPFGLKMDSFTYYDRSGVKTDFSFIYNDSEYLGAGSAIPNDTYYPIFTVEKILGYYYNKSSIIIKCVDTNSKIHYLVPVYRNKEVAIDIKKNISEIPLSYYKYVSTDGK